MTSTVSLFYDKKEDRLKLLFSTAEQQQLGGVMTRRLFKILLQGLPDWFATHITPSNQQVTDNKRVQTKQQHDALTQFEHQAAQDKAKKDHQIKWSKELRGFFIDSISLTPVRQDDGQKKIMLSFISSDNKNTINLNLTVEQFHTLLGSMLDKVADWGLSSPWADKGSMADSIFINATNNGPIH